MKWTFEKLQEESLKYQTRGDFNKESKSAYTVALKKGLIDKLFINHINLGYNIKRWKKYIYTIYVYELSVCNKAYIGLTNNIKRRDKEHLFNEKTALSKFCKENNLSFPEYKILEKDLNPSEAQNQEKYWVDFYKNSGWEMFNIAKTGSLGGGDKIWTNKKLQEESNKYQTRGEFWLKSETAATISRNKGLLNKLFEKHKNMGYSENRVHRDHWTKEILQEECNKYSTRLEFKKNNYIAYKASHRKKLLNELFKNHDNNGYIRNFKKQF